MLACEFGLYPFPQTHIPQQFVYVGESSLRFQELLLFKTTQQTVKHTHSNP